MYKPSNLDCKYVLDVPTADTRQPFKGLFAFDRNSQEYIPFKTKTDAMLASLMLAYRLASPILAVVLALVRHPNFNPSDITLQKPEDVWSRVKEHEASELAAKGASRAHPSFPFSFPRVVLDEVIDYLEAERCAKLHAERDSDAPYVGRLRPGLLDIDLRNASLVCKEWTRPAQRALGRILCLHNAPRIQIINALNSSLFGGWTREIIIFRGNLMRNQEQRLLQCESSEEDWELMARLVSRVPNVRTLSLNTDWFEVPVRKVTDGLNRFPSLRELRIVKVGDIAQLLGMVCKKLSTVSALAHLHLQFSGNGSVYSSYVPPSDLEITSPSPSLRSLSLRIGSVSELALTYLSWLTRPREGEGAFKLTSLALDLSPCYYGETSYVATLRPCFHALAELRIVASGLGDGLLASMLADCAVLRRLTLVMRHTMENGWCEQLPATLEALTLDFSFAEAHWHEWDQRFLCFVASRACPALRRVCVRPVLPLAAREDGEDAMANRFPLAKAHCEEMGIEYEFAPSRGDDYRETNPAWTTHPYW